MNAIECILYNNKYGSVNISHCDKECNECNVLGEIKENTMYKYESLETGYSLCCPMCKRILNLPYLIGAPRGSKCGNCSECKYKLQKKDSGADMRGEGHEQ